MATLKDSMDTFQRRWFALILRLVQLRLKSIKNIAKITKSMKMIASTKLVKAQKAMEAGRVFGQSINRNY